MNTNRLLLTLSIAILGSLFFGCKEDEPKKIVSDIKHSSISAMDISNKVSSEDILVRFTYNKVVDETRLFIIPGSEVNSVTDDQLLNLSNGKYMLIPYQPKTDYSVLLENITDINGSSIVNGKEYSIGLIYRKGENNFASEKYATITLTDKNPILGKYIGTWNDNLFSNVSISFKLENESFNVINAELFVSNNYQPTGGAANDGTILLELDEDQPGIITTFRYDQNLPNYMGGCPGLYTGEGTFDALSITISFIGDDCDGHHTDGTLSMERQF